MRALLMPAVVAAVQINSPSQNDATQMRETFYSLAEAKTKNGGKIDDDTKEIVRNIMQELDEKLIAGLWTDRNEAQTMLDSALRGFDECSFSFDAERQRTKEAYCDLTSCLDEEKICCDEKTRKCELLYNKTCDLQICDDVILEEENECVDCDCKPDGTNSPKATQSKLHKTLECMVKFDDDYYEDWTQCWDDCEDKKAELATKQTECEEKQRLFEVRKCQEQKHLHGSCDSYANCWHAKEFHFNQTLETMKNLEGTFQKQYEALQCLKCYGEQILSDSTDLSKCDPVPPPCYIRDCADYKASDHIEEECPHEHGRGVDLALCVPSPPHPGCCDCEFDSCVPGAAKSTCNFLEEYYGSYASTCASIEECLHSCPEYDVAPLGLNNIPHNECHDAVVTH